VRKYRWFPDGWANGSSRPEGDLQDCSRKRSSAEGVGLQQKRSFAATPNRRRCRWRLFRFVLVTSRLFGDHDTPTPSSMTGAPEAAEAEEHHGPGRRLGNAGGWGRRREVEGRRDWRSGVADHKVAARGVRGVGAQREIGRSVGSADHVERCDGRACAVVNRDDPARIGHTVGGGVSDGVEVNLVARAEPGFVRGAPSSKPPITPARLYWALGYNPPDEFEPASAGKPNVNHDRMKPCQPIKRASKFAPQGLHKGISCAIVGLERGKQPSGTAS
jgi:hypothetical protein